MMRQFLTLILAANLADVRATRKHPAMAMQEVLNHDIKKAPGFSENPGINHNKYINLEQWQKMTTIQEIVQGRPMEQLQTQEELRSTSNFAVQCGRSTTSCETFASFENIWGYGCHCYFGESWDKGRGTPVNPMDSLCQDMNTCYKCIILDAKAEGDTTCNPAFQDYLIPTKKDISNKGLIHACHEANLGNNCAIRTCCCDTKLADGIIDFFFNGYVFDPTFQHANGFDPAINCPIVRIGQCNGNDCELQCCGVYPDRYTYKTGSSIFRECCVDTVFNSLHKQCCPDGSIISMNHSC